MTEGSEDSNTSYSMLFSGIFTVIIAFSVCFPLILILGSTYCGGCPRQIKTGIQSSIFFAALAFRFSLLGGSFCCSIQYWAFAGVF